MSEEMLDPLHGVDFSVALQWLKKGHRISREGWNGKGMFAYYVPAAAYQVQTGAAKEHFGEGALVPYNAYMALKGVDGVVSMWVPSVNDCLSEDWTVHPKGEFTTTILAAWDHIVAGETPSVEFETGGETKMKYSRKKPVKAGTVDHVTSGADRDDGGQTAVMSFPGVLGAFFQPFPVDVHIQPGMKVVFFDTPSDEKVKVFTEEQFNERFVPDHYGNLRDEQRVTAHLVTKRINGVDEELYHVVEEDGDEYVVSPDVFNEHFSPVLECTLKVIPVEGYSKEG